MGTKRDAGGMPDTKVDTVAGDGAAVTAVGTDAAAVAVAEAEAVGGAPAAGQGHAAEVVEGAAVRDVKVPDGADALRRPAPDAPFAGSDPVGDAGGTFPRSATDTGAGALSDTLGRPRTFVEAVGYAAERGASRAVARRSGRDDILPMNAPKLDPETVPGLKIAKAAAQVRHNGRSYLPGERFPIDFVTHAQFVPIGAIEAVPWGDLPGHDED